MSTLPTAADALLCRFRRRRLAVDAVRVGLWALAADLAAAVAAMHLDRFAFLAPGERLALTWACHGAAILVATAWLAMRLRRRATPLDLAYAIEARRPELQERLVTVASLAADAPADGELRRQLIAETEAAAAGIDAASLVPLRALRRATIALTAVVALHGLLALLPGYQYALMARRLLSPGADLPKASFLRLEVRPAGAVVARGDQLAVQAEVAGELPAAVAWLYQRLGRQPGVARLAIAADGAAPDFTDAAAMSRVQRRLHVWTRASVDGPFTFRVRLGDAESAVVAVEAVERPRILGLALAVTPPAYTGRPAVVLEADGSAPLAVPAGSAIELRFRTDRAVTVRELLIDGAATAQPPAWDETANTGTWSATATADLAIELRVRDARGFASAAPARLTVAVVPDGKPSVRLDEPADGLALAPGELVPVRAALADDLGLAGAAFRFQLNPQLNADAAVQELPLELPAGTTAEATLATGLDLERTGALPGDQLVFQLRVRDSAGQDGLSAPVTVRVVPLVRGEDERRRLQSLQLLAEALAGLGEAPALPEALANSLVERAGKLGLPLEGQPDGDGLLALLEREHHLTAVPRHRQDLRRLHGLLGDAFAGPGDRAAMRAELQRLLPGLTAARWASNLLARLLGLQAEAEALRLAIVAVRAAGDGPGAAERRAPLQRRGKLYLAAVQEVGADLLAFARSRPGDDAATERRVGDLNTAAYQLGRAGTTRSLEACSEVIRLIGEQAGELLPVAEALRADESAARGALAATEIAARTALASTDADSWAQRRCLDQLRLISREPFAAPAETALLALLAGSGSARLSAATAAPAEAEALGLAWERQRLLAAARIPAEDRRVALALIPVAAAATTSAEPPALPQPAAVLANLDAKRATLAGALAAGADPGAAVAALERAIAIAPALIAARLAGDSAEPAALEELLVRLRTAAARWLATSAEARSALAGGAGAGAPALAGLAAADQGLAKALAEAGTRFAANAGGAPTLPLLVDLARARRLVAATTGPGGRTERAAALLAAEPLFARALLAAQAGEARNAREAVAALAAAWQAAAPDRAVIDAARQRAEGALRRIASAVAATGEAGAAVGEILRAASGRLEAVPVDGEPARARLALEAALPEFDRLLRRIVAAAGDGTRSASFSGGPTAGSHALARGDAQAMRQELAALDRHAEAAALAGLLDADAPADAAAWARLGYRLLLSELAGPPAARSAGGGNAAADRLKDWLRREIDEARREAARDGGLQTYPRPTREYLDTIEDLLRY